MDMPLRQRDLFAPLPFDSEDLAVARDFQRKAQFYVDFIKAENSMGFHAPQESARILAESIDFSRQGQVALRRDRQANR
jgi:nitrite reductase (cytochrome c-552)